MKGRHSERERKSRNRLLTLRQCVLAGVIALAAASAGEGAEELRRAPQGLREAYQATPMPPAFQVVDTDLEGPVFAEASGRTLYIWPRKRLRNGVAGDNRGARSQCGDKINRKTAGLQSPWPAGLLLPDIKERRSCAEEWPPVLAAPNAEPLGSWSIILRDDGAAQWAYEGYPLYVSALDHAPGDTYGGSKVGQDRRGPAGPALRYPIGPPPDIPPGFSVASMVTGRLLVSHDEYSVYAWDGDGPNSSNCLNSCLGDDWLPIIAPRLARPHGEWSAFQRTPGVWQWAYRDKPVYLRAHPSHQRDVDSLNLPAGWTQVYTQRAPVPPAEFTTQETAGGRVLADAQGKTIYVYSCGDDSIDQLACDHPDRSQALRLIVCGGGDEERCLSTFPPVPAPANATSVSRNWSIIYIDRNTGRSATPTDKDALRVWAYRGRPIYTFVGDEKPGDINANGWGEKGGVRNGYKAFWLVDVYFDGAG